MDDLCVISNKQPICVHKNKNLQECVSVTNQREALKFWISLKPKSWAFTAANQQFKQ